jgi:hypothetical protein
VTVGGNEGGSAAHLRDRRADRNGGREFIEWFASGMRSRLELPLSLVYN